MDDMDFYPYDFVVTCGIIWKHALDVHIIQLVTWGKNGQIPFAGCHTERCRRANRESPFIFHYDSREIFVRRNSATVNLKYSYVRETCLQTSAIQWSFLSYLAYELGCTLMRRFRQCSVEEDLLVNCKLPTRAF